MNDVEFLSQLPLGDQLQVRQSVNLLIDEFSGVFDAETVEHFTVDSFQRLAEHTTVRNFLGVLSERFARERLSAMASTSDPGDGRPGILFLCVHNAGRSQMAAGWLRQLAGSRVRVYTGGSEPASELNPVVVEAMSEVGIDISAEFPKPWTDEIVRSVDAVISMGCGDVCPVYPGKRYVDWELADPAGQDLGTVRVIRDELRQRIEALLATLEIETNEQ